MTGYRPINSYWSYVFYNLGEHKLYEEAHVYRNCRDAIDDIAK